MVEGKEMQVLLRHGLVMRESQASSPDEFWMLLDPQHMYEWALGFLVMHTV